MADEHERIWNYPDLDIAVITNWPLLKKHNWTYRDMLEIVKQLFRRRIAYPLRKRTGVGDVLPECPGFAQIRPQRAQQPGWQTALAGKWP